MCEKKCGQKKQDVAALQQTVADLKEVLADKEAYIKSLQAHADSQMKDMSKLWVKQHELEQAGRIKDEKITRLQRIVNMWLNCTL